MQPFDVSRFEMTGTPLRVSDRVGRKPVWAVSGFGFIVLSWPMFWLLCMGSWALTIIGFTVLALHDGPGPRTEPPWQEGDLPGTAAEADRLHVVARLDA